MERCPTVQGMPSPEGVLGSVAELRKVVRGRRPRPGFSVVAIACGTTGMLRSAVRDVIARACGGLRCVVMSKKSASRALSVVRGCRRRVAAIVDRPSRNLCSTVGGKVGLTAKSCLYFLGTNSNLRRSSALLRVMRSVGKATLPKMLCKRARVISDRKRFLCVHHLSTPTALA